MAKNRMGKGSLHAQDAQLNQNMPDTQADEAIGSQATRPYVHKRQATRSSKPDTRKA